MAGGLDEPRLERYMEASMVKFTNDLINEFRPLVKSIAGWLSNKSRHISGLNWEDLESVGYIGLMQACKTYDQNSEASFNTFARYRIRGAMQDEIQKMGNYRRSKREWPNQPLGFDDLVDNDSIDVLSSFSSDSKADKGDISKDVIKALNLLKDKDRAIFILYFYNDLYMHEIGEYLGITESRVCQRMAACKEALRESLDAYKGVLA